MKENQKLWKLVGFLLGGGLTVLIVIVLVINWRISVVAERELDKRIRQQLEEIQLPLLLSYSSISVNPMLGRTLLENITVSDKQQTVKFSCDALKVRLSRSDIIKLVKGNKFESINPFSIVLDNLEFKTRAYFYGKEENIFSLDDFTIRFDGHVTKDMFQDMLQNELAPFPEESQRLTVSFNGLKVDIPEVSRELLLPPSLKEKIFKVDKVLLKVNYNARSKTIAEQLKILTPISSLNLSGLLEYSGSNFRNFELKKGSWNSNLEILPAGLKWGEPDETGRYSLGKVLMKSELEYDNEHSAFPKGTITFLVKDLKGQFSGRLKQELKKSYLGQMTNVDMAELVLDKFSISCKYDGSRLRIFDTELSTPLLSAILNAEVDIHERNVEDSLIKSATLTVKNLTKNMETALLRFGGETGLSFLRKRKGIILEIRNTTLRKQIAEFYYNLTTYSMEKGFRESALRYAEKSVELSPAHAKEVAMIYVDVGKEFLKDNKMRQAKAYFEKAISLDEEFEKEMSHFYFELGKSFLKECDFSEVFQNFDKALQYNPKLKVPIAKAFVECSNPKDTFSRAIRRYGNSEVMEYLEKFVLVNKKTKENAAKIIYELAGGYLEKDDEEMAVFWAQKASEWTPLYEKGLAKMYQDIGIKYYSKKTESRYSDKRNREKARELLGKAIELDKSLENDENVYFIYYIETSPDGPDLKTCKGFLEKFPNSNRLDCVLGKMAEVMKKKP